MPELTGSGELRKRLRNNATRLRRYLQTNWLPIFSAFVIGLGLPLWRYLVIEKPAVRVEITQVEMDTPANKLKLKSTPALKPVLDLFQNSGSVYFIGATPDEVDLDGLGADVAQRGDVLKTQQAGLQEARKTYTDLKNRGNATFHDLTDAIYRIQKAVGVSLGAPPEAAATSTNQDAGVPKNAFDSWIANADTQLKHREESNAESLAKVAIAQRAIDDFRTAISTTKAQIRVHCAVSNAGGGAVSLKPQALLRAFLGGDNYIDVRMRLADYEKSGELEAKGSKIMRIESDPLETMSPKEREQIIAYFKGNTPAQLFLADIESHTYTSNVVPFASGLYDDKVYEMLRTAAGRDKTDGRQMEARFW